MADTQFGKNGWTPDRIGSLKGKTIVITGTTSGTGFEAAKILLSKNAKVVMLNRNPKKASETMAALKQELGDKGDMVSITMDLGDQASVRRAAEEVLQAVDRIDALMCNGAIAQVPKRQFTVDGHESQLGVNFYGHWTLQDRLKKAGKTNVKAYACHPGSSRTALIKTSGSFMMRLTFGLMKLSPMTQPAENGAYPELMCATEPNLKESGFYGPTGRSNWVGPVGEHKIEPHAKDKAVAKKLWEVSEKATGVSWNL